ncbi:MAG TPA: hypothetical protein PKD29_02805 [Rhodocyclaceae bacterium]|nr:hypothetical protein [Rhodocyclaceae bacterium]
MVRVIAGLVLACISFIAHALSPYVQADKLAGGDLKTVMSAVEQKLSGAGFHVIGRHVPKGIAGYASVVVTDAGILDAVRQIGGTAIVAAPIRVGVKADGAVSYMNPEYWYRAYLRGDYTKAEAAVRALAGKLEKALGKAGVFGGDVKTEDLSEYRYMFGMERFHNRAEIKEYKSFEEAVRVVRTNLDKGVAHSAKVYELVLPDQKLAVFGFAMNDPETGEAWWVRKTGPDHVAALPWEVFVVGGKVMALHARYRTALSWPALTMGTFMGIGKHPDYVLQMAEDIAGVQ